jgi:mannose-6-phosphate isomerase-like protein (cupin superfamily)
MSSSFVTSIGAVGLIATVASCASYIGRANDEAAVHPRGLGDAPHLAISSNLVKWNPLNANVSISVLSGSPDIEGAPFVMRLKLVGGTRVPPHWHPVDEHLTVVSGTLHMGIGKRFNESLATAMAAGTYCTMPKSVPHYGWVTGETVVQIHGTGPFKTYPVDTSAP